MDININIKKYYITKFGIPIREAEFLLHNGKKISILKWHEDQTKVGVSMYATIGANAILSDEVEGCEFFLGITPEVDDVAQAIAETAVKGNGKRLPPSSGDSITLTYELWRDSTIRSFLFTDGDEIIQPITFGVKRIKFIQLVPLFETELEYKKKYGEEAMWREFEKLLIPYWNSNRSNTF